MPKQIILEYPWKAILYPRGYYIINIHDSGYPKFAVLKDIVCEIKDNGICVEISYNNDSKIGQFFHQCQTELNN